MPSPARAHARGSARTRPAAPATAQRTSAIARVGVAWKNSTSIARRGGGNCVSAKPRNSANTTTGNIALCAAAISALLNTMPANQSAQPGGASDGAVRATAAQRRAPAPGCAGTAPAAAAPAEPRPPRRRQHRDDGDQRAARCAGRQRIAGGVHAHHHQRQHQRHHRRLQGVQPQVADGLRHAAARSAQAGAQVTKARPASTPATRLDSTRVVALIVRTPRRAAATPGAGARIDPAAAARTPDGPAASATPAGAAWWAAPSRCSRWCRWPATTTGARDAAAAVRHASRVVLDHEADAVGLVALEMQVAPHWFAGTLERRRADLRRVAVRL